MIESSSWSAATLPERRIGHRIEAHLEIGSTNDRVRELLSVPDGRGVAVIAERQSAGRGRRGRSWVSPAGRNLTLSVGLQTELDAGRAGLLGIASALAVCDACRPYAELAIKWPNDVVDAVGRKVAGLLIETTLDGTRLASVIIGIGINVNWRRSEMPAEIAARATSLADLAGAELDRVALLRQLLGRLDEEINALEAGESPLDRYGRAAWLTARDVVVTIGERAVEGTVRGADEHGALLLATPDGELALTMGEVTTVRERTRPSAREAAG